MYTKRKFQMEKYLSFTQIADELGVPARTIYHLNQIGKGPKCFKVGRTFRVASKDYEAWLAENVH
jgi:predicted DNA-binding transcriptional regulator AlpA